MKSILRKMVAVFCLMVAMVATVDAQSSFAYQAVIRTANGEVVSEKKVSMRFSLKYNNEVVYSETHQPTTSKYGNVEVKVGEGQKVSGDFAKVPWHTMQVMMQIEADPNGGTNYIDLGAIQLQPAPYAMHAASTGLVVDSSSPKSGSGALFEVKDKDGNPVFAVYPDGVRVYVDDADGKAMATGFAVAGRRAAKDGEEANLFSVTGEGTQVTVDDAEGKAMATGFAVAGRRAAKDADAELFTVNSTGTQVYIDTDADGKAMATGFAVAGRRAAKDGETDKYLEINDSGTQIYIDDDAEGKPIATGFAVAGRRAAKGNNKYMEVTADGTTVFVDNADGKAMATGFAVAGRRAAKGKNLKLFEVNEYGTHIYIDEDAADKAMATGFAVAGRRAAKDGNPEKYMVIDADGAIIYVDYDDAKAMQTGFAVAGRRAAKDGAPSSILTVNNQDGTHVYIDDAEGKAMQTGFAVAGRRAAKDGQYIMQITDKSALMVTQNLMIDDKESNKSMMTMTTEGTIIKTENFVVAKEVENSDGTMEETSVFQATPEQGVQIAAESKVVVKGDVAQSVKAEAVTAADGAVLPRPIEVYSRIVEVKCAEYATILGQTNGYKLLKIHGNGLFSINDNFDADGNAVIMFNKDSKVTYDNKSAALVVILTNPDSYKDAKMIFWPCCQINNLIVNFGLMDADGSNEYLPVQVVVNSVDGGVSRVELLSANEKMGTVELDGVPAYGSIVSAVAKPKPGFEFDGWGMGDGEYIVERVDEETGDTLGYWEFEDWRYSNPYNFAVGFDTVKLTAIFRPIEVWFRAEPLEGGKIEVRQKVPKTGNGGTGISEGGGGSISGQVDYFTMPPLNNGQIKISQFPYGDSLIFVAIPEPGYKFAYWSMGWNDDERITDSILNIKVEHSMEIVAHFVQDIDGPEKFGNSVGNDENKKFNEWYTEFYTVESSESGVDDEGAYVKFKTVNNGGSPYNAQFNNILKGLPGQKVGNRFTLSFEAKWEPDKDVYGENAPGAAKLYLKTGKRINDGDGYQWEDDNTELLDEEGQIFRENYPKVINNEWNSYVWEAIIGEAGENFNDDYGMGAQIGIEMDLIDGGLNSGTFRFRNITVSIYDENSGQQYSATYFEKKVAQEQPKRLIEIAEPIVEGNNSPLITIYAPDNTKLEPYFSEETEINTIPCRLYTYYAQISDNSGTNFQFKTNEGNLNLYRFTSTELNEYSKITSNKLTFEDFDEHKAGGKSYNETGKYYVFNQPISLENRFVAMMSEKYSINVGVEGKGEVSIKVDDDEYIITKDTSFTCEEGCSVELDVVSGTFYGWYEKNEDGTINPEMKVYSYDNEGNKIPEAYYSFDVSENKSFVARFAEEEQQENNGDKATIQIMTNEEIILYKILDLNGNSDPITPYGEPQICVDPQTNEPTGDIIYTYECNVGDSIQLLANVTTTNTFYGWYGNFGNTEFKDLTADSFRPDSCLGYEMVGDEPVFQSDYLFRVKESMNRFVAMFDDEQQQPTGAKIQVKSNGQIQLTVGDQPLTANETQEGDGYTTYTFTCAKGDNVTFTASRGKRQEFMGWWDEEYFNRYDYHYQDEPYMGKGDIIIEEGDREAEYKKKTEEFHEQHCVGGFSGEYPDYVYNLEFDSTIVEDSYTFIADFYTISSETIGGVAYSITDEDAKTCKVSSVDKELNTTINIPAKVSIGGEEFSVTSIGSRSFDYCKCSEVIIQEGVTTIEGYAFYFCDNITSLSLPNTISFVGKDAFYGGLANLQYYTKDNIKYLGNSENNYVVLMKYDYNNDAATNIEVPEGCCFIYAEAFKNFDNKCPIGGVTIPNTVKGVGYNAFYSQKITTLDIPEGVTYIDEMAFYSCRQLTSVSIPSSLDYVGQNAFNFQASGLTYNNYENANYLGNEDNNYVCLVQATQNDITSCEINSNCKLIEAGAFSECTSLSSVTIPGSVKSIGSGAFYGCTGLANLDVPEGVKSIGYNAFNGVVNINYYGELDDHDNWGAQTRNCHVDGDFAYSDATKTTLVKYIGNDDEVIIPNTVKTIGARAFYDPNITNVTIPSSVTTIGDYAFYCNNNFKLKALTVPESVTAIGSYAFNSIMNVVYNGTAEPNESYDGANWGAQNLNAPMDENFIYADDGKTILQFIGTGTEIDIPNTVTTIAPGAFSASEITSVNIPSSVTEIGESVFSYCSSLESVSIPASVTKIGKNAFRGSGLNSVRFESVADLCRIAFANEYSNPMYHWENADVSLYFGDEQKAIQSVEIPNTMDSIGQYAFYNCKQLTSVSIPASVKRIGANAFGRCNNISRVTIAEPDGNNGLQEIGYKAFNECAFPTIVLPNTLTTIGNNAFDNCDNLVSVVIPESVISMGNYVFSYIEHNVVIFCLETGDSDIARYEGWGDYWDSALDYNPDVKIAVVKENRNAEEPNIVRGDNGLLYFIYRYDASEETSNIDEYALQNLTSETNFTATNGEAIVIGYHGSRSDDLELTIPSELGDDSKALRSEVVAIARYAFRGENIASLTIGGDGSKAASTSSNLRFIGQGAFCNAWLRNLTINGNDGTWYKYNYAEGGDAQTVTNMNANELTTYSCGYEFYRDILPQTFFVQPEREGSDCDGSEEKPFRYFAQAINSIKNSCKSGYTDFTIRFALQEGGNKKSYMGDSIANGYGDPSNLGFAGHMRTLAGQNARVTIDFSNVEFQYFVAGTFSGLTNLVGVVLPEGIAMIPDSAFFDCPNLDSVNIPSSVASIGRYAFGKTNLSADDFTISEVSGETWFRHKLINAPDVWSADDLVDDIDDLKESLAASVYEINEEYGYAYYRNKTEFIHVGVGGYSDIEDAIYSSNMFNDEESKNTKFVIYVDGTLNANQTLPSSLGKDEGSDISYFSKSILIMGSGTDAKIDAGWRADGSGTDNNMPALAIYTNVPVTIKNLTITGGSSENAGGVFAKANSDLTIAEGTVIEGNNAYYYGGGVRVYDGKLTMTGGKITNNQAGGTGAGGGIWVNGTADISGGEISDNYAAQSGGGIYVAGRNTTIHGNVVIKDNRAAINGSGIYVEQALQWGGAATVEGDNDIYLCSGKYITITEELDCEENEIVATITPYSYDEDNLQVVSTDESLELDYADSHFAITPDSESNTYHLVNGYMVKDY